MRKFYFFALIALMASAFTANADGAKWEQVLTLPECYAGFATSHGTVLASDQKFARNGGIYFSEDQGDTWTKCAVEDYNYAYFFEYEDYVFALGTGCMVARSSDWGKTWEVFDYLDAADELMKSGMVVVGTVPDNTYAYSGIGFNGRIFVANMNNGVFVSDDFGETWNYTDPTGLALGAGGNAHIYCLNEYDDVIYGFGAYSIFKFDIVEFDADNILEVWEPLSDASNFMTQVTNLGNKMVAGRGINNADLDTPFLFTSTNGIDWEGVTGRPQIWNAEDEEYVPLKENYVSALGTYHNPENGGSYLLAMTQHYGVYSSTDMGATWADFSDGLPLDLWPNRYLLTHDDTYVYAAIFGLETDKASGIYRFPLSEIPATELGIETVVADEVISTEYFDLSGRQVKNPAPGSILIKKEVTNNGVKATKVISE